MGIHDRIDPFSNVIQLHDLRGASGNGFSSDTDLCTSDDTGSLMSIPPMTSRIQRGRRPLLSPIRIENYRNSKRVQKRLNMMNTIKELVGIAELEEDKGEPVPRRTSAFYELFSDHHKMQIWNEFIELSEEDQKCYLNETSQSAIKEVKCEVIEELEEEECDSSDEFVMVRPCRKDKRAVHPSYSSAECFLRIQPSLRARLKRHAAYGMMERVEIDMRSCFMECSYAVYDSEMETPFGRLVAHIVAQYLGLDSFTMDSKGERRVKAVNKRNNFSPPPDLLAHFLEGRHYQRQQ